MEKPLVEGVARRCGKCPTVHAMQSRARRSLGSSSEGRWFGLELTGMTKREIEEGLRWNETKRDETRENSEGHGPPVNSSELSLAGVKRPTRGFPCQSRFGT